MRRDLWLRVFEGALVGSAPYVKTKGDVDEFVARARMLADKASSVVAPEDKASSVVAPDGSASVEEEDAAPFPLVRRATDPCPPPLHFPPESGSFLFDGPGLRDCDVDELEARR